MSGDEDYRIAADLTSASRCAPYYKAKGSSPAAKLGLQYENRVHRELLRHVGPLKLKSVEHTPWYKFNDVFGNAQCSPDFILIGDHHAWVLECKLTWVPHALQKLKDLYCPVIAMADGIACNPVVVCKHVTPATDAKICHTLFDALNTMDSVLHWPHNGHILWK